METTEKTKLTHEQLREKYLPKREVFLKRVPGKDLTLIKANKISAHSFMYNGAIIVLPLPMDDRKNYYNPFESDEEREFFEKETERNLKLDYRDPTCAWNDGDGQIKLRFQVDEKIKQFGYRFDLSMPYDALMYRVAKKQRSVAHSFKEAKSKSQYLWYLSDGEEETNASKDKFNLNSKLYMEFGKMQDSKEKMKEFLELYYMTIKEPKEVPQNISEDALKNEIQTLIENFPTKVEQVLDDPNRSIKVFLLNGIKVRAIEKSGVNSYNLPGQPKQGLEEFIDFLKLLEKKKDTDDTYGVILQRIELAK